MSLLDQALTKLFAGPTPGAAVVKDDADHGPASAAKATRPTIDVVTPGGGADVVTPLPFKRPAPRPTPSVGGRSHLPAILSMAAVATRSATDLALSVAWNDRDVSTEHVLEDVAPDAVDEDPDGAPAILVDASAEGAEPTPPQVAAGCHDLAHAQLADPLEAAWEVDALTWPDVVTRAAEMPSSALAELVNRLSQLAARGVNCIGIGAGSESEGSTTVALTLAKALAAASRRVVLVDGDLANPQLGERLGLDLATGWRTAMTGERMLGESMVYAEQDDLTVAPLSEPITAALTPREAAGAADCLLSLREEFEIVLVDCGGLSGAPDSSRNRPGSSPVQAMLLVRRGDFTSDDEIAVLADDLMNLGIEPLGVVENFAVQTRPAPAAHAVAQSARKAA